MGFLQELEKEREVILKRLNAIETLLESYNYELKETKNYHAEPSFVDIKIGDHPVFKAPVGNRENLNIIMFPISKSKEEQLLWVFKNVLRRGIKLPELQKEFTRLRGLDSKGREINIHNLARRLKKEGKLIFVQYNLNKKLSFWGLEEWLDESDFKDEFRPTEQLPSSIYSTKIANGNKKHPF